MSNQYAHPVLQDPGAVVQAVGAVQCYISVSCDSEQAKQAAVSQNVLLFSIAVFQKIVKRYGSQNGKIGEMVKGFTEQ